MKEQETPKRRETLKRFAPLLLWIGIIFFFSSPEASSEQTSRIIGPLLHLFYPTISPETEATVHAFVRKCAHFTEYAILAALTVRAFSICADLFVRHKYFFAFLLVAAVASLDEFNQSFEASRTSSIYDVLLDCAGGLFALGLVWWINVRYAFHVLSE